MLWLKNACDFCLGLLSKTWEALKKLPGWALVAFLVCGAVVVHLFRSNLLNKRRAAAKEKLQEINIEYAVARTSAEVTLEAELDGIRSNRDAAMDELDIIEEEISEAAKRGPVGIAEEWKSFLAGGGK